MKKVNTQKQKQVTGGSQLWGNARFMPD